MRHAGRVIDARQGNASRVGENGTAADRQTEDGIDLRRDFIGWVRHVTQSPQERGEIRRHRAVENVARALKPRLGNVKRLAAQIGVGQNLHVRLGEKQPRHAQAEQHHHDEHDGDQNGAAITARTSLAVESRQT